MAEHGAGIAAAQDAARLNTPDGLRDRLTADWGGAAARDMAEAHLSPAPHDLTLARPCDLGVPAALLPNGSLRLTGRPQISALPGYAEGAWWPQDAAAALPARLIPTPDGKRVLDVCAAPGGKTLQLAAAGARVTALDISARRVERMAANLARTGLTAEIVVADALDWTPQQPFDAILVDAPCSSTGTIRRHPELPHRLYGGTDRIDLGALTDLQSRLLDRGAAWLRPGGVLVFCTCSLFKAEGEDQARAFLDRNGTFERSPIDAAESDIPAGLITSEGDLRTRPDFWASLGGIDGFFAARFRRIS
jgi:16S rRNA (cytosine967-C5)-methyltransferase